MSGEVCSECFGHGEVRLSGWHMDIAFMCAVCLGRGWRDRRVVVTVRDVWRAMIARGDLTQAEADGVIDISASDLSIEVKP